MFFRLRTDLSSNVGDGSERHALRLAPDVANTGHSWRHGSRSEGGGTSQTTSHKCGAPPQIITNQPYRHGECRF
jgi:hypothetical protein